VPAQRYYSGDFSLERLNKRPLLYISLGTAFNNQVDFYQMCFDAFAQSGWQVVLSFGTHIDPAALKEPPTNFLIAPHVPQLEVLSRADLFISHGGMNSTMESLWFGVPLVVVPQMIEQEMNAHRVQELGLGLALDKETLTAEKLRAAVEQVAHDPSLYARVQAMQQEIRQAGGYQRAADAIICYTHGAQQAKV
jgi:MGT family glycosyltransferase